MSDILFKMTSPEGITLNTEATYVDKNIAVTPELEDVSITPTKETQTRTPAEGKAGIGTVTVNPIPSEYIKPSGKVIVWGNNATADVKNYEYADFKTAQPLLVSTEAEMTGKLTSDTETVGNVYKYTGPTTDTYENGALYLLEEVSE